MFLFALYISAQLTGFYRDIGGSLSGWFLRCAHTLVINLRIQSKREVLAEEVIIHVRQTSVADSG